MEYFILIVCLLTAGCLFKVAFTKKTKDIVEDFNLTEITEDETTVIDSVTEKEDPFVKYEMEKNKKKQRDLIEAEIAEENAKIYLEKRAIQRKIEEEESAKIQLINVQKFQDILDYNNEHGVEGVWSKSNYTLERFGFFKNIVKNTIGLKIESKNNLSNYEYENTERYYEHYMFIHQDERTAFGVNNCLHAHRFTFKTYDTEYEIFLNVTKKIVTFKINEKVYEYDMFIKFEFSDYEETPVESRRKRNKRKKRK